MWFATSTDLNLLAWGERSTPAQTGGLEESLACRPYSLPGAARLTRWASRGVSPRLCATTYNPRSVCFQIPSRGGVSASSRRAWRNNYVCPNFHHLADTDGEEGNRNLLPCASMKGWYRSLKTLCAEMWIAFKEVNRLSCILHLYITFLCTTPLSWWCERSLKIPGCLLMIVLAYLEGKEEWGTPPQKRPFIKTSLK